MILTNIFRAIAKSIISITVITLLTSCISIHWVTEEEAKRQMEFLNKIMSDEEVGWDPTEYLRTLASIRMSLESDLRSRHMRILSNDNISPKDRLDIQQLLTESLFFAKQVAGVKPFLETFGISILPINRVVPLNIDAENLFSEMGRVSIELTSENEPKAFAFIDKSGVIPPKILISVGLLRDLVRQNQEIQQQLDEIRELEEEINRLPERNGVKVVRNAMQYNTRLMNLAVGGVGVQEMQYEYLSSVLFVVSHELAHATYDRFKPPQELAEWPEIRADWFAIFINEILLQEGQTKKAADIDVLRGGFHTNDPATIIRLQSDAGYRTFLNVYRKTKYAEGDLTHLTIEERERLLKPAYDAMFKDKK